MGLSFPYSVNFLYSLYINILYLVTHFKMRTLYIIINYFLDSFGSGFTSMKGLLFSKLLKQSLLDQKLFTSELSVHHLGEGLSMMYIVQYLSGLNKK